MLYGGNRSGGDNGGASKWGSSRAMGSKVVTSELGGKRKETRKVKLSGKEGG